MPYRKFRTSFSYGKTDEKPRGLCEYLMNKCKLNPNQVTTHKVLHPNHTVCPGKYFSLSSIRNESVHRLFKFSLSLDWITFPNLDSEFRRIAEEKSSIENTESIGYFISFNASGCNTSSIAFLSCAGLF